MTRKLKICVLYFEQDPKRLTDALYDRLWGWRRAIKVHVSYVNLAFWFPIKAVNRSNFDVFVLDTTLLRRRWNPVLVNDTLGRLHEIETKKSFVMATPHDECSSSDALNTILAAANCQHVFSCAERQDHPIIYPEPRQFTVSTILSAYISPRLRSLAARKVLPLERRNTIVSYRANHYHLSLGLAGWAKEQIGRKFATVCEKKSVQHDIKIGAQHRLGGAAWLKLLRNSRTVLGAQSGSTVLDTDGLLNSRLQVASEEERQTFNHNPKLYFDNQYEKINLLTLSARHLEAACTLTPQVLMAGDYNQIFVPHKHYIPVAADFSNVEQICEKLADISRLNVMATSMKKMVLTNPALDEKIFFSEFLLMLDRLKIRGEPTFFARILLYITHIAQRINLNVQRIYQMTKT